MTDLKTIALLQEKATKGPWKHEGFLTVFGPNGLSLCHTSAAIEHYGRDEAVANAEFLSACGSFDFPALCDEMERMRDALEMISALACYATEEDTGARENALIEIGKHARDGLGENR